MFEKMTTKLLFLVIFCLLTIPGVNTVIAEQTTESTLKIAIFDLQKVFGEYQKTKELQAEFERQCQQSLAKLEEKTEEIERLKEELITQELVLTKSAKEEKKKELMNKEKELQDLAQSIREETEEKRYSYTKRIIEDILLMCQVLKEEGKYDLILDKNFLPDVSEEILLRLNAGYKEEK